MIQFFLIFFLILNLFSEEVTNKEKETKQEKNIYLGLSFGYGDNNKNPTLRERDRSLHLYYKFTTTSFNFSYQSTNLSLEKSNSNSNLIALAYFVAPSNSPENITGKNNLGYLYYTIESNRKFIENINSFEFGFNRHFDFKSISLLIGLNYQFGLCNDNTCGFHAIIPKLGIIYNFENAYLILENRYPFRYLDSSSGVYSINSIQTNWGAGFRF